MTQNSERIRLIIIHPTKNNKKELGGRYQENSSLLLRCLWHMSFHFFWRGNQKNRPEAPASSEEQMVRLETRAVTLNEFAVEEAGVQRCWVGRSRVSFLLVVFFWGFDIKWMNNYFKSNVVFYSIISGNLCYLYWWLPSSQISCNKELTQLLSEDSKRSPSAKR